MSGKQQGSTILWAGETFKAGPLCSFILSECPLEVFGSKTAALPAPSGSWCPLQAWRPLSAPATGFGLTGRFPGRTRSLPTPFPTPAAAQRNPSAGACQPPPALAEGRFTFWADTTSAGYAEPQAALLGARVPWASDRIIACSIRSFHPRFQGVEFHFWWVCLGERPLYKAVCGPRGVTGLEHADTLDSKNSASYDLLSSCDVRGRDGSMS